MAIGKICFISAHKSPTSGKTRVSVWGTGPSYRSPFFLAPEAPTYGEEIAENVPLTGAAYNFHMERAAIFDKDSPQDCWLATTTAV